MLEEIRKKDNKIPFIIYTDSKRKENIDEALKQGAQGFTDDPRELIDLVIKNLLKK